MSRRSLRDIFVDICVELPQNEELNGTCPVCDDSQIECYFDNCSHGVCKMCRDHLLKNSRECPLCRKQFQSISDSSSISCNYQEIIFDDEDSFKNDIESKCTNKKAVTVLYWIRAIQKMNCDILAEILLSSLKATDIINRIVNSERRKYETLNDIWEPFLPQCSTIEEDLNCYVIKPSKIIYKNGIIYEGEYYDIYPHGKGVLYLDNNCIIRGTFDLTQTNLEYEFEIPSLSLHYKCLGNFITEDLFDEPVSCYYGYWNHGLPIMPVDELTPQQQDYFHIIESCNVFQHSLCLDLIQDQLPSNLTDYSNQAVVGKLIVMENHNELSDQDISTFFIDELQGFCSYWNEDTQVVSLSHSMEVPSTLLSNLQTMSDPTSYRSTLQSSHNLTSSYPSSKQIRLSNPQLGVKWNMKENGMKIMKTLSCIPTIKELVINSVENTAILSTLKDYSLTKLSLLHMDLSNNENDLSNILINLPSLESFSIQVCYIREFTLLQGSLPNCNEFTIKQTSLAKLVIEDQCLPICSSICLEENPCLQILDIGDNCFTGIQEKMTKNLVCTILNLNNTCSIQQIYIGNSSFQNISYFSLYQPHLCSLIVGENSFQSCKKCDFKSVFFDNSSQIGTLSIGNHSFTQANLYFGTPCLYLSSITFGEYAFQSTSLLQLQAFPSAKSIVFHDHSFENCILAPVHSIAIKTPAQAKDHSIIFDNFGTNLEILIFDGQCFNRTSILSFKNLPSLQSIKIKKNTFDHVINFSLVNCPKLSHFYCEEGCMNRMVLFRVMGLPNDFGFYVQNELHEYNLYISPKSERTKLFNCCSLCMIDKPYHNHIDFMNINMENHGVDRIFTVASGPQPFLKINDVLK